MPSTMTTCVDCMRMILYIFLLLFCQVIFIAIILLIGYALDSIISNPPLSFTLHDVTLSTFNISTTTSTVTSDLQITISGLNNDDDNDFHFDDITVYACYQSQQITLPTMVPPVILEVQNFTVWSPYLNGTEVPVSPYLASALVQEQTDGNVGIDVKLTGNLTSEYGPLSRRFRVKVSCPVEIKFGNKNDGNVVGVAVKGSIGGGCNVEV